MTIARAILFAGVIAAPFTTYSGPAVASGTRKGTAMTTVSLGEHAKLVVSPSERGRVRKFYVDVLGCEQTKKSDAIDIFRIGKTLFVGIVYQRGAQSASARLNGVWLELRTADPAALRRRIEDFGIEGIKYWDKDHFYFQAPGGQVFRLVADTEDMSKWQR